MRDDEYGFLDRLRVTAWAAAVLTQIGGVSAKASRFFDPSRTGRASTVFYKCLAAGRPWPDIEGSPDRPGPAMRIESEHPGTLIWLIHPIWRALGLFPCYMPQDVMLGILAMRTSVQQIALPEFTGISDEGQCCSVEMIRALHQEGSLDALLAMMLISRQAFCLCDVMVQRESVKIIDQLAGTIECVKWMPPDLHQAFIGEILQTVSAQRPRALTVEAARSDRMFNLDLESLEFTGKSIESRAEDVEAAIEGSGIIRKPSRRIDLPEEAREFLQGFRKPRVKR
jgi:hypothetical protein